MKLRDQISKKMKRRMTILFVSVLPLIFVPGSYLMTLFLRDQDGGDRLRPFFLLIIPGLLSMGAAFFLRRNDIECPNCGTDIANLGQLGGSHAFGLPQAVKFCPYCSVDFDTPVAEFATGPSSAVAGLAEEFPELSETK